MVGACLPDLHALHWSASSLWAGPSPRVVVAIVGRIYLVAIGRAWFGTRFGIAATIRLYERLSSLMDVYSGRACAVHVTLHGAFYPGCSCRNGFENA